MTDIAEPAPARRRSLLPLVIGVVLAVAAGAGGYFAVASGLILKAGPPRIAAMQGAFVPVPPLVISLGPGARSRHLRFAAQLEVAPGAAGEVTRLMPRVLDVLNGYLRAIEPADFDDPAAFPRIRAQMLRRVQVVTGEGRVNDLLVTEFVLN
ncbi:MAG: flagellar basal body-associated protein FliL [Gemmobacter sp.]